MVEHVTCAHCGAETTTAEAAGIQTRNGIPTGSGVCENCVRYFRCPRCGNVRRALFVTDAGGEGLGGESVPVPLEEAVALVLSERIADEIQCVACTDEMGRRAMDSIRELVLLPPRGEACRPARGAKEGTA